MCERATIKEHTNPAEVDMVLSQVTEPFRLIPLEREIHHRTPL
jgi:hypothetical protein